MQTTCTLPSLHQSRKVDCCSVEMPCRYISCDFKLVYM